MRSGALSADFIILLDGASATDTAVTSRWLQSDRKHSHCDELILDFLHSEQKQIRMNPLACKRHPARDLCECEAAFRVKDAPSDPVWTKSDVTAAKLISCTAAECEALWLDDSDGSEMIYSTFVCFLFYWLKCVNPAPLTCHLWVCSSVLSVSVWIQTLDPDSGLCK